MHRDVDVAMIKALVGLARKTYQTGTWPGIEECTMCGGLSASRKGDRIARGCDGRHIQADFAPKRERFEPPCGGTLIARNLTLA
jgi:hypothetical protein